MGELLVTLRAQHVELAALCKQLTTALHGPDDSASASALQAFGAALLTHLSLGDEQLYPRLLRLTEGRTGNARMVRTFADNMVRVSESLKAFLARPVSTPEEWATLRRDWPSMEHLLDSRIQSEERVLYPMYEDLMSKH